MRDEIEQYRKARVQPFGVNPAGVESHRQYAEKFRFPFPLLVDEGRRIAKAYGAVKLGGVAVQRSVVLVGQDGRVRFAQPGAPGPDESLAGL
ncbi:MAG: redoxin domain-containing protein [Gemmatimonadetes bacterium]|nr:redoxin domain-containing protein [Gemmatimonadota bacterium]